MEEKKQIVSILFSDIKDYSKIKNDDLYVKIKKFNDEIERQILNQDNHFFSKTWGDAFFICSFDPVDLANIALDIRDKFRNTNWRRLGFSQNIKVRIGLHTEKVRIIYDNERINDVIGHNINSTARIEPIVEPNHVYCSKFFKKFLETEENINFKFKHLGIKKLAKEFGEENLYELLRDYEIAENEQLAPPERDINVSSISIKKNISQKDLHDFLIKTFKVISQYFELALKQLEDDNPEIETIFLKTNEYEFNAEIFLQGESKTKCRIWLGDEFGLGQIFYSEGASFSKTSYNECLSPKHDGFNLYLKSLMGYNFGHLSDEKISNPKDAAEYLWFRFTKPLSY